MNVPMNLRELNLWEANVLSGIAFPLKKGAEYRTGDIVDIQEPFKRLLAIEKDSDGNEKKITAGVIYRSDNIRTWSSAPIPSLYYESARWSPASQLPDYAVRRRAAVTGVEIKPLQSFTDQDIHMLRLDYPSQGNPQILMEDFLSIKNFELFYSWWKKHYKSSLKKSSNPMAVILRLEPVRGEAS